MKHLLPILSLAFVLGLVACTAESTEGDDDAKIEQASQPLLSSSSGGISSGGLGNWCQDKLDCENKCIRMYPGDAQLQAVCKRIEKCASKCGSTLTFQ